MLRINPMVRRRLADPRLAELLEQMARLERSTAALTSAASDDLHRLVPDTDEKSRGRLLALRRDIHNDRPVGTLPDDMPASVVRWWDHHARRVACRAQIRGSHGDALARERSQLRELLGEGDFQTTLAQSAPGVYDAARRYRHRPAVDSKDRKAERALAQYLTRAMVRTSPYGRFTAVGLAQPDPDGVAMGEVTPASARPEVDVDRALFEYVMGGLVPAPQDALISLPPTARVGDDAVTFFQVGPDAIRRLSAPMNRQTRVLVELLDLGPCRRSTLALAVAARLGLEPAAGERLLAVALRLGLVVTGWRGDQFVAAPVEQAQQDLALADADEVLPGLRRFQADLGRFGDARLGDTGPTAAPAEVDDAHDRVARQGRVESTGDNRSSVAAQPARVDDANDRVSIQRRLETLGDDLSRVARRPARLIVNEDYILNPLDIDPGAYRGALDDLAAVTELLWAFDRMHVVRALVTAAMVERFGAGCQVPLVEQAEALVRAAYQAEGLLAGQPDAPVGPADGSLLILSKVKREALSALGQGLDGPEDVRWAPADLRALVEGVPERFRLDPASYGVVVQPDGHELVLNDTYAGHGPMVSRFLHADGRRGGSGIARLRRRIESLYGPGWRLLEDRGTYGVSINAHPPVLSQSLDPEGWRRLRLAHDAATDTVSVIAADGAPVKVLALGAQLPELLPYPVRLATWLCSSGRVVLDVAGTRHRERRAASGPTPTTSYARLRVGDVIVSRRRWYPGSDFPAGARPEIDEVDHLLAVTRWRARHGVPAEVMLKSLFDGPTLWNSLSAVDSRETFFELRRHSKPQYVDLASALMTRILPRLMERRPDGCIEEALPGLAAGGHATEWMVELARPAGRNHFDWAWSAVSAPARPTTDSPARPDRTQGAFVANERQLARRSDALVAVSPPPTPSAVTTTAGTAP